jgi:hypothetical protein
MSNTNQPIQTSTAPSIATVDENTQQTSLLQIDPAILAQWMSQRKLLHDLSRSFLVEGTDYAVLRNTERPVLLKPGAEKILYLHNCSAEFTILEAEVDHDRETTYVSKHGSTLTARGFYRYVVRCEIRHRSTGLFVGSGIGVASTAEPNYANRPRELENTILKMAAKRAMVDAVVKAFALSDLFTQDLEDMPEIEAVQPPPANTAQPAQSQQPTKLPPAENTSKKPVSTVRLLRQAGLTDDEIEELANWASENDATADVRQVVTSLAEADSLSRQEVGKALAVLGYRLSA